MIDKIFLYLIVFATILGIVYALINFIIFSLGFDSYILVIMLLSTHFLLGETQ